MYPFTVQLPYVNGYMSILIHGYIINRYTPPASARITPFISNSNSNALIRFTGMLVSITNVLICNPSGILPSRFTIRSSSSLKSGNNSRCTVFSVLGLLSHPMAFTKSSADVISTAWFFLSDCCSLWNIRRCIVPERQNSPGDNFPPVRR